MNSLPKILLCLLLAACNASAQVIINEFMAGNKTILTDENGDYSDWIELLNTNASPVNLDGWYLTDTASNLTKWRIPATNLPPNSFLIVFASNKNRAIPGNQLHSNFALSGGGEYLGLVLPDGVTVASHFTPTYPEQIDDISYGRIDGTNQYFLTPTPGAANSTNIFTSVAEPQFSHSRAFQSAPFSLSITSSTAGASVRYTTNGSPPSATNGFVYSAPLQITNTTVVRAAAFKTGFQPSTIDTHTYIFVDDVIYQSTNGFAPPGWPTLWGTNKVDYGMDPAIVNSPSYAPTIKNDLKALPTVSLVMKLEDLFDPVTGIYANAGESGSNWERPASVELIHPDGSEGFQVEAGVRIRGGFSTAGFNPKHSFRLLFRSEYGDSALIYPLFGEGGTDTFAGGVDLATFQNYSWSNPANSPDYALFLRDHFSRDTQLAMGHQGERGIYAHLYINGQYWGIYSPSERPEASYASSYYGGVEEDYDVVKSTGRPDYVIEATDGDLNAWTQLWRLATNGFTSDAAYQLVQGNNPDGIRNLNYPILLDVDNLIDYQLVVAYVGNRDGPLGSAGTFPNNFFSIYKRDGSMGFRFFVHDFEHSLFSLSENRIGPYSAGNPTTGGGLAKSSPQYFWQQLQQNANFRLRVADHVHRHFFNDGVLTTNAVVARFKERTNQLHHPLVAESARWGDATRAPQYSPYTRDTSWMPLVNDLLTFYFPHRSDTVLNQLKAKNLYPNLVATSFNQHGGAITNGFPLTIAAPFGTIYYTLDNSDPRLPGGAIAPGAQTYSGALNLWQSSMLNARVLSNGVWSAMNSAAFTLPIPSSYAEWVPAFFTPVEQGNPAIAGPNADADLDGFTNNEEFLAGSNPRDPLSALRIEQIQVNAQSDGVSMRFHAAPQKTYSLQHSDSPTGGTWNVLTNIPAQTVAGVLAIPDSLQDGNRYYRIVTPAVAP